MKVKKLNERTKTLLLSVGIVLVLCVFGIRVVPRLLPHGPQGQLLLGGASAHTTATPSPVIAPTPPAGTTPASQNVSATPQPIGPATDPFWRPLALSLLPSRVNAAPAQKPVTGLAAAAKSGSATGAGFSGRPGSVALAPIAPPPMPDVALQGIVQDATAIAVLEVGGQSRFMKAGEKLEGGWTLASIQAAGVVLRQGRREVVLALGQTLPKETPQVTPQENRDVRGIAQTLPPFHSIPLEH